jgi:transposase, IS30 family
VSSKNCFKHFSSEERDKMGILLLEGKNPTGVAKELRRNVSTITRELKRPTVVMFRDHYVSRQSDLNLKENKKQKKKLKKTDNPRIREYIIEKIKLGYSPMIVSKRIEEDTGFSIGKDSIYDFVYKEMPELTKYLTREHAGRKPRSRDKKTKRTLIPNRTGIEQRPETADKREEFGHFEADTIVSSASLACLLVIADRKTRKVKIKKLARKTADLTSNSIIFALQVYNIIQLLTITYDNGSEFCWHDKVNEALNMKSFFCNPYSSWEKGTVENINGLIRRFFPKGTDFDTITDEQIQYVEDWINNRPMGVLDYKTPNEKYEELFKKQSVAV